MYDFLLVCHYFRVIWCSKYHDFEIWVRESLRSLKWRRSVDMWTCIRLYMVCRCNCSRGALSCTIFDLFDIQISWPWNL